MRELDDPENPYLGQYEDWDVWFITHPHDATDEDYDKWNEGDVSYYTDFVMIWMSPEGFPKPMRLWWRDYYEWQYTGIERDGDNTACKCRIDVYGEVDPEMERMMHRMMMEELAQWVPEIPQWLVDSPPRYCAMLPDGNVVSVGELGVGADAKWRPGGVSVVPKDAYYLYSPAGELLRQTAVGEKWWSMYFPEWDAVAEQYSINDEYYAFEDCGIVQVVDAEFNEVARYTYTGEELPLPAEGEEEAGPPAWPEFYGRDLAVLYEIQHPGAALAAQGADQA